MPPFDHGGKLIDLLHPLSALKDADAIESIRQLRFG